MASDSQSGAAASELELFFILLSTQVGAAAAAITAASSPGWLGVL